jgi:hypothetical protein
VTVIPSSVHETDRARLERDAERQRQQQQLQEPDPDRPRLERAPPPGDE